MIGKRRTVRFPRVAMAAATLVLFFIGSGAREVSAQSGMLESLQRLDRNTNGEIEPEEITSLARPFMERIATGKRLSLNRPNSIEEWREAARIYFALQNGVDDKRIRPQRIDGGVRSFEPLDDEPLVPEFGLAEVKYPYNLDDLDEADDALRGSDRNRDGYLDRREAQNGRWTHRDPFEMDFDGDDRLSRLELAQRYARRRLLDQQKGELIKKAWRTGSGVQAWEKESSSQSRRSTSSSGQRDSSWYLTLIVLSRLDANRNGRLEEVEAAKMGVPLGRIDEDRSGDVTREELHDYLETMKAAEGESGNDLPAWYYELDTDRDQQLSLAEFATTLTEQRVAEFDAYDVNSDGILTQSEISQARGLVGGSYQNETALMLPPRRTVTSEIFVSEDYVIGDLNVQLSITHSNVGYLNGFLVGPGGQRVELFTAVGSSGDHFDQTVFDDQSRIPITKAKAPFKGVFQPEAIAKRKPGLSEFNGTNAAGQWQLIIEGPNNDRFGMLHRWALKIRPDGQMPGMASNDNPTAAESGVPIVASQSFSPTVSRSRPEKLEKDEQQEEKKANIEAIRIQYEKLKDEVFGAAKRENRSPTKEELAVWKAKMTEFANSKKQLKKAEKQDTGR